MNTSFWGPGGWKFLHSITFNYPTKIDRRKPRHIEIQKYVKQLFLNLQYTLPCKFCRESYKQFIKDLPISNYLNTRHEITWWLYAIHNMVNQKLRKQEQQEYQKQLKKLQNIATKGHWPVSRFRKEQRKLQERILYTKPDPSYAEVCAMYESQRSG